MRRWLVVLLAGLSVIVAGCSSPGDVSRMALSLGESDRFSRADLEGAADAVLTYFGGFEDCTLLELTDNEAFSDRKIEITGPDEPQLPEGGDVVVFDSSWVDNKPYADGVA